MYIHIYVCMYVCGHTSALPCNLQCIVSLSLYERGFRSNCAEIGADTAIQFFPTHLVCLSGWVVACGKQTRTCSFHERVVGVVANKTGVARCGYKQLFIAIISECISHGTVSRRQTDAVTITHGRGRKVSSRGRERWDKRREVRLPSTKQCVPGAFLGAPK